MGGLRLQKGISFEWGGRLVAHSCTGVSSAEDIGWMSSERTGLGSDQAHWSKPVEPQMEGRDFDQHAKIVRRLFDVPLTHDQTNQLGRFL